MDVSCVPVGLTVLSPSATRLSVGALHVCRVAITLYVVRVARCVVTCPESTSAITSRVGCDGCKNCDGEEETVFHFVPIKATIVHNAEPLASINPSCVSWYPLPLLLLEVPRQSF